MNLIWSLSWPKRLQGVIAFKVFSYTVLKMTEISYTAALVILRPWLTNWLADHHICRSAGATDEIPIKIKNDKMIIDENLVLFHWRQVPNITNNRPAGRKSKHLKGRFGPRVSDGNVFGPKEVSWDLASVTQHVGFQNYLFGVAWFSHRLKISMTKYNCGA